MVSMLTSLPPGSDTGFGSMVFAPNALLGRVRLNSLTSGTAHYVLVGMLSSPFYYALAIAPKYLMMRIVVARGS